MAEVNEAFILPSFGSDLGTGGTPGPDKGVFDDIPPLPVNDETYTNELGSADAYVGIPASSTDIDGANLDGGSITLEGVEPHSTDVNDLLGDRGDQDEGRPSPRSASLSRDTIVKQIEKRQPVNCDNTRAVGLTGDEEETPAGSARNVKEDSLLLEEADGNPDNKGKINGGSDFIPVTLDYVTAASLMGRLGNVSLGRLEKLGMAPTEMQLPDGTSKIMVRADDARSLLQDMYGPDIEFAGDKDVTNNDIARYTGAESITVLVEKQLTTSELEQCRPKWVQVGYYAPKLFPHVWNREDAVKIINRLQSN